jgi:hypothetical protein
LVKKILDSEHPVALFKVVKNRFFKKQNLHLISQCSHTFLGRA